MPPSRSRPEPMNASPHHSKVKVSLSLSDPAYVSGAHISGKMQLESRADLDSLLGIGIIMVELHAIQEVHSGEHSATSTFIHSRRIFQGPGLPLSNAVYSDPIPDPDDFPLPAYHYPARRGQTTFFFQFLVPPSSPSSISFGPATIKYEVRASVSVAWRGDTCLVTDKREVKVVECWDPTNAAPSPQAVAITDGGKIWAQATLTNGVVVGGESASIDLQLKNHTQRWTSGVTVTLTRDLHFPQSLLAGKSPPKFSDVTTQVEFRGPEYSVPPGIEGMASLVIDIPRRSRGVKGGPRADDNGKLTESFFEVRCTLSLRIDMPPGSEETVITLPLTVYHSLAVPEIPASPPHITSSPYPYIAPISSGLLPLSVGTALIPVYTGNGMQQHDSALASFALPASNYLTNQHLTQGTHNWQDVPSSYAPPTQRSVSVGPRLQASCYTPGLSSSYTSSPRFLLPQPTYVTYSSYIHPAADSDTVVQGPFASLTPQNFHLPPHHLSVSPSQRGHTSSHSRSPDQLPSPTRARPPPIQIPSLPNPHDSHGIVHSPRPVPSPKHSFCGLVPKSDNVSELERIADEVGRRAGDLSLDLPEGDAIDVQGPQDLKPDRQLDLGVNKTLPAPPVPSNKDRHLFEQRPRADTFFMTKETTINDSGLSPSTDHLPRAPPTPPIAAITPIKFPKAQTELSGLRVDLGNDVPSESGLDALERRLLAEVGTRKLDVEERPHVRSIVQPITIPPSGPPLDTVNDSAISSLTLADRDGILKAGQEREQDQDRDSDERTQHMGGGRHTPSEDDRDARTQKGKSSRKLGKSKHSEEDLERSDRRRQRKKAKDEEGRKLRQEAKGRVAAWLGEIDVSVPPVSDDPASFISPTTSHFVPISESASFGPAPAQAMDNRREERPRGGDISTDKDVSASPNPRSSGFVTISSLNAVVPTNSSGRDASSSKPSARRFSLNDFQQKPTSLPNHGTAATQRPLVPRSPSAEVKCPQTLDVSLQTRLSPQPSSTQPTGPPPGRLPRFPPTPTDPEMKYDVRSARGGRGGRVTQVASIWAAKASANANVIGDASVAPALKTPKLPTSPLAVRKPALNMPKCSPMSARLPLTSIGLGAGGGGTPAGLNREETRTGVGVGAGLGAREVSKASKATTVPAILSSSHAVPMLSSTASLARVKAYGSGQGLSQGQARSLPPMISETISDLRSSKSGGGGQGQGQGQGKTTGDLAFGQARLRDLIKKYQG